MSKVIKLTQTDLEKIVTDILSEQEKTEEVETTEQMEQEPSDEYTFADKPDNNPNTFDVVLGRGKDGFLYAINAETGQPISRMKL